MSAMLESGLRERLARGAFWSLIGSSAAQGGTLLASILAARMLGRETFGQYMVILSTVGTLSIFAGFGAGATATRYVAELRQRDPRRAGRILALGNAVAFATGALLAAALFVWAPELASKTLNAPALAGGLRTMSALLLFNAINGAQTGALSGFEAFRAIARINTVRGLVTVPATIGAVLLWGLTGALVACVGAAAAVCCLSQIELRRVCAEWNIKPAFASCWQERRLLWTFSTPALLSSALTAPTMWIAGLMLVNQPGGYAEMGVFGAATHWRNAIMFLPSVVAQFALPLLSNLNAEGNPSDYVAVLRWNVLITAAAASCVALPVCLAAPWIMRLYGSGYETGWPVLSVGAITAVICCVNAVVGTAILSAGSVWWGFAFNGLWSATFLGGCLLLAPSRLALGVSEAMLIAYLCHSVWQALYLRRHLAVRRRAAADAAVEPSAAAA